MLVIARTTTTKTVQTRISVSCDGRCQLPLLSRPKKGLSILLVFTLAFIFVSLNLDPLLVEARTRHLTRTSYYWEFHPHLEVTATC